MGRHFARGMVVLADGDPSSDAPLRMSREYADRTVALAPRGTVVPDVDDTAHPRRGELTIDALLRAAAGARIPWVAMRRDVAAPVDVLRQLLESAGRHSSTEMPGFAAVLAGGPGHRPIKRILVVLDRVDGQPSGLMVLIAVAAAQATGASLDVLLLGAPGETLTTPRTADDVLRITRDVDLAEQARRRADESGIRSSWIVVEDVADRTALVLEQVAEGDYDLLIDDLGAVRLGGRMGRGRRVRAALGPGGPGWIARAVLEQTDVPVAIVLDAVRLGLVPPAVVKGGAGAVLALGILASAAPAATASSADRAKVHESVSQSVDAYEAALNEAAALTAPIEVQEAIETAQASTAESWQIVHEAVGTQTDTVVMPDPQPATQVTAATDQDAGSADEGMVSDEATAADADDTPTDAPAAVSPADLDPEDVSPGPAPEIDPDTVEVDSEVDSGDVAKAQKAADGADDEVKQSRKAFDDAQQEALDAVDDTQEAADQAGAAADALAAAEASYNEVYAQTEATLEAADGLSGALRSDSQEQIEAAEQAQAMALVDVDEARIQADEALAQYQQAAMQAATASQDLLSASEDVTAADAAAQQAHATAEATEEAYEEALAQARVTPVPGYAITTGHGASGSMWSTGTHTGVDYAAPSGTEVVAAASGTVVEVSSGGAYGNRIVIEHEDGYRTSYSHLSAAHVSVGQEVTAGDHIGAVGSTGNSSGPHLHFEVTQGGDGWSAGNFLDPADWLSGPS